MSFIHSWIKMVGKAKMMTMLMPSGGGGGKHQNDYILHEHLYMNNYHNPNDKITQPEHSLNTAL